MQDLLDCAINWTDWFNVLCELHEEIGQGELTNLDMAAIACFETNPDIFQSIVKDAEGGADSALKGWIRDSIITWIQSPEAHERYGSPVSIYARACFDIVFESVDWDKLTEALLNA